MDCTPGLEGEWSDDALIGGCYNGLYSRPGGRMQRCSDWLLRGIACTPDLEKNAAML